MKKSLMISVVVLALSLFVSLTMSTLAGAQPGARVAPSFSNPFGQSYSDWSASWWQWAFLLPTTQNPLFDTADCSEGQSGRVWFLGGTYVLVPNPSGTVVVGEADRTCNVPVGTALFFPIFNAECDTILTPSATEAQLRGCANSLADKIQDLEVTVDGVEVDHLSLFRFESDLFSIGPLPADNLLGASTGATGDAVGDGFYIMLRPLSRGSHDIHFGGSAVFTLADDGFDLTVIQDITYEIEVEP